MSDKAVKTKQNKPFPKALKWSAAILGIAVLELGSVFASVKVIEARNQADAAKMHNAIKALSEQEARLKALENLPAAISTNSQQLAATAHAVNILAENFEQLQAEVGNKQLESLTQKISDMSHKIEVLEEQSSEDALALNLALLIKENALYQRSFDSEADVLSALMADNATLKNDIEVINRFKQTPLADNLDIIRQYQNIAKNFSFLSPAEAAEDSEKSRQNAVSKSVNLIKNTVAGMHFDKVIVLKKEKKTAHQKELLKILGDLVEAQKFAEALSFVAANPEFNKAQNQDFALWQVSVRNKLTFDEALNNIIASQLNALRQDMKNGAIKVKKTVQEPVENNISPAEEMLND